MDNQKQYERGLKTQQTPLGDSHVVQTRPDSMTSTRLSSSSLPAMRGARCGLDGRDICAIG
jgi:hypothetical protein